MSSTLSLSEHLTQIIESLRRAVAAYGGRNRAASALVVFLWGYLHRVAKRFAAAASRPPRAHPSAPPAPREPREPRPDRPVPPPRPRLPQGFGWLGQFGSEFRCYGSQLQHLLRDPQMRAFLADSPQAARILRPLCRMLGIEPAPDLPPALFVSAKPRKPVPRAAPPATEPPATAPPRWRSPKSA